MMMMMIMMIMYSFLVHIFTTVRCAFLNYKYEERRKIHFT